MSILLVNSLSLYFNFVLILVPFEFSPCIQGSVAGSAFNFKIPTQVHHDLATLRFSTHEMQHALSFDQVLVFAAIVRPFCLVGLDLLSTPASVPLPLLRVPSLIVHVHFSMRAFFLRPWCLILVCCHPFALANSCNYATSDTTPCLLLSNLLIAALTSRYVCINFECGGVSRSLLSFLGTRHFSV